MKIKEVRKILGLTQTQIGKLMGLPQSSVARIESGKHPETKQQKAALKLILERNRK